MRCATDDNVKKVARMAGNLKLGIEIALQGVEKVTEGVKTVGRSIGSLGDEFKSGLLAGMQQAIKEADRSLSELKTMADDARKSLNIRSDMDIKGDIDKARQAYEDLKSSGVATAGELNRAKDSMKAKIGELRVEMGKWSGDWEELGKKAQEYGSKLQGIGAKAMIAGAPAFIAGKDAIKAEYDLASVANTAGLNPAQAEAAVAKWKAQINELARYTNQTQGDLITALGTFVSKGMDPEKALEMLRSVGKAATATGSEVTDIAESMFQAGESLKIPLSSASKSLDMMAAAGAAGSFELKNMAKDLPNLSAKYASLGGTGADALGSITAGAQIAMKTTSDAAIAANNFKNFLDKLAAPETIKNFDKMGVNLTEQVKKGVDSGDLVGYMGGVIEKMTQGKAENLGKLFTDAQARDYALALTQNIDEYKKIRGEVMSAVGTIDQQADVIARTTQEKIKSIGINFSTSLNDAKLFQTTLDGIKSVAEWFAANPEVFGPLATIVTALAVGGAGIVVAGTALSSVGTAIGIIAAAGPALVLAAPAIATIVGVIAAWKVGEAIGTWANEQINLLVQAFTGDKFATLGTALYDAIEGPNGIIAIFNSIPEKLAGLWDGMKKAGADLMQSLKDGFTAGLKGELGIGDKLASAVAYIKSTAKDWINVGRDIIQGLIDGVVAKSKEVIDKIRGLGSAAVREMKDILGIKSPSKVFMVIGEQIGEGMEIGMQLKVKSVSEAAKKLGVAAAYGAKDNATALWIKGQLKDYDALVNAMSDDAKQAAKARQKATDEIIAEGAKLTASLRTDLERAMDDFDNLERLLDAGAISWDTYAKAVSKTTLALKNADQPEMQKISSASPVVAKTAWEEAASDIERSLTDALMRGFEGGKDAAKNFKDTIVNTLKTAFLKPIAINISASIMGAVGMGGTASALASGVSMAGGASNIGGTFSILSGLKSAYTAVSTGFAALGTSVGLAAETAGNWLVMNTSGALNSFGSTLMSNSGAIGTAASSLGGMAVGFVLGKMISGGYSVIGKSGNTAVAAGTAIGSIFGPIGAIIGGIIGGAVNALFGRKLKASGIQGQFSDTGFAGENYEFFKGGLFRSDKTKTSALSKEVDDAFDQTFQGLKFAALSASVTLGGAATALDGFTHSVKLNLKGMNDEKASVAIKEMFSAVNDAMAEQVLNSLAIAEGIVRDGFVQQKQIVQRLTMVNDDKGNGTMEMVDALVGVDVPAIVADWGRFAKAGETAGETLARLHDALATVNNTFSILDVTLHKASLASAAMASSLADAFGGLDKMQAATGAYFEAFFSEEEQIQKTKEAVTQSLSVLGLTLPESKAAFRSLVESLDMTTQYGETAFVTLMGLAPAFATVADYAEAAAIEAAAKAKEATDAAAKAAEDQARATSDAARAAADAAAESARNILATWQTLGDSLVAEIKRIRGVVAGGSGLSYAKAQADFGIATAQARAGDQKAAEALPTLSQTLLEIAESFAGSRIELQRIRATTAASLEGTLSGIKRSQGFTVPAFASGGSYAGGLALVGENGPELINFRQPGLVHTSAQTASIIGNADALIAEVIALREEVTLLRAETRATVSHTSKTARLLERVMPDGDALATRSAT